jgi:hypothetical protein
MQNNQLNIKFRLDRWLVLVAPIGSLIKLIVIFFESTIVMINKHKHALKVINEENEPI